MDQIFGYLWGKSGLAFGVASPAFTLGLIWFLAARCPLMAALIDGVDAYYQWIIAAYPR